MTDGLGVKLGEIVVRSSETKIYHSGARSLTPSYAIQQESMVTREINFFSLIILRCVYVYELLVHFVSVNHPQ